MGPLHLLVTDIEGLNMYHYTPDLKFGMFSCISHQAKQKVVVHCRNPGGRGIKYIPLLLPHAY